MPITPESNKNIIMTKRHINDENDEGANNTISGKLGNRLADADAKKNTNRQISTNSIDSGYSSDGSIHNRSISDKLVEKTQKPITYKSMLHNFNKHFKTLQFEVSSILPFGCNIGMVKLGYHKSGGVMGSGLVLCLFCARVKVLARPLRIEYAGALYHVTSRGNAKENIYRNDKDRMQFYTVLAEVWDRFN